MKNPQTIQTRREAFLTDDAVKRVLEYWNNKGPKYRRTYLFFKVLANTGARRSEALGFFVEDLKFEPNSKRWYLQVERQRTSHSKKSQEAYSTLLKTSRSYGAIFISEELAKELLRFAEDKGIGENEPFFPLGRWWADNAWSQTVKALKLDPRLVLHSFCSYHIAKKAPTLYALEEQGKLTKFDIEDILRKDERTIRRYYRHRLSPEEIGQLLQTQ